jgi:NAD+ kinase
MLHWLYNKYVFNKENMLIKKVGILYHPMIPATYDKAQELSAFLGSRNINVWICSAWETDKSSPYLEGTDLILTTGGDGTILRVCQITLQNQIPITGVNMGKLGFLTEIKADEAIAKMPELLEGKVWIDERAMLEAELIPADPNNNKSFKSLHALNDVVVARGSIARLIQIKASIDNIPLTNYRADGVLMATATGSTGYALSAGGPILYPQSTDMLLVPVVPHLNLDYSLVLPGSTVVVLQVETTHQATISIDGHTNIAICNGDIIKIRRSSSKTRFLRLQPQNYFYHNLEEKLRGKR